MHIHTHFMLKYDEFLTHSYQTDFHIFLEEKTDVIIMFAIMQISHPNGVKKRINILQAANRN